MKHIILRTHSPISRYKTAEVTWADVWLRLKQRRKTTYLAPCLCGSIDLSSQLETSKRLHAEREDEFTGPDLERHAWAMRSLSVNGYAVDNSTSETMPEIFSNKDFINRIEAERLLALWLTCSLGFKGPFRFHWKPPKHIVHAITPQIPLTTKQDGELDV